MCSCCSLYYRKLYVILAIGICLVIGGMMLFFLYPRTINLNSSMPNLTPDYLYVNATENILFMTVVVSPFLGQGQNVGQGYDA